MRRPRPAGGARAAAGRRACPRTSGRSRPGPRAPSRSPSSHQPPRAANTASRDSRIAACAGGARRCATTCRVKATPTDSRPPYRMGTAAARMASRLGRSTNEHAAPLRTAHTAYCTKARATASVRGESQANISTWPVQNRAPTSTSRSPRSMVNSPVTLNRYRPPAASAAPEPAGPARPAGPRTGRPAVPAPRTGP